MLTESRFTTGGGNCTHSESPRNELCASTCWPPTQAVSNSASALPGGSAISTWSNPGSRLLNACGLMV